MTRELATVSRLPSGRGRGRSKTRLASAVDGSERELLVVLRRKLAAGIDQCTTPAAVAALIRQFRDVDKEIRQIDAAGAGISSSGRRSTGRRPGTQD